MTTAFTTHSSKLATNFMYKKPALVVALALLASPAQADERQSVKERMQARGRVCIAAAEVARTVTADTLRSNTFDPDDALIKHTQPNSDVREILTAAFGRGTLIRNVLIGNAGFGATVMPQDERDKARLEIGEFAFLTVRNQCVIDAMVNKG